MKSCHYQLGTNQLGKFLSRPNPVLPNPGIMAYVREIIPIHGRKIQVSEIL